MVILAALCLVFCMTAAHALADYGHYVQPFLSKNRGWKLGEDYAVQDKVYTKTYSSDDIL